MSIALGKAGMGWSITALADEFGLDRKTVSRLMETVLPCGTVRSHAVYQIKDAMLPIAKYILSAQGFNGPNDESFDPESLPPKDRKDWFDSELKRIQHAEKCGQLIPVDIVANADAEKNKKIALALDTMADVLERDMGLTIEQVHAVNRIVDSARNMMYESLAH